MRDNLTWRRPHVDSDRGARRPARGRVRAARARAEQLELRVLLCGELLAESAHAVHFSTTQQSMWGPGGPAVIDSGTRFFGPQWNTSISPQVGEGNNFIAVDAFTSGKVGVDFRAVLDPGSVDASYGGEAQLRVTAGEGDTFHVTYDVADPVGTLNTRSPNIDIESNFVFEFAGSLTVRGEITSPDVTVTVPWIRWVNQCTDTIFGRVCVPIPVATTRQITIPGVTLAEFTQEVFDFDVATETRLLKFTNDPAAPVFEVLGFPLVQPEPGSNFAVNINIPVTVRPPPVPPAVGVEVTDESNPAAPKKPHSPSPFDLVGKFSMGDITLEAATLFLEEDEFSTVGDVVGLRASGATNVARIDIDADFMAAVLFPGTVPPLGASAELKAGGFTIFSLTADLLDVDIGPQFSIGQDFEFVPTPMVELTFSQPVTIGGETGTTHSLPAGEHEVTFAGAASGEALDVTPRFYLANEFRSTTGLLVAPSLDLKVLALNVATVLGVDLFDGAVYDPEPFVGPAVTLATLFDETYGLGGFNDVDGETIHLAFDQPPVIEPQDLVLSDAVIGEGGQLTLGGAFANPNATDAHRVSIDWGDGAVTVLDLPAGVQAFGPTPHAYAAGGLYDVTVTVVDDDGQSDDASTRVHVSGAGVQGGVLRIVGTGANDTVEVSTKDTDGDGTQDKVRASASFIPGYHRFFDIAGVQAVHVQTGGGNDKVSVWGSVPADSVVEGGDGADTLWAGRRSILVGGAGPDSLNGADGNDVLVPGLTTLAGDTGLLLAVLRGELTLDGATGSDDGAVDTVAGNRGVDTFYLSATDLLRDSYLGRDGPEAFFEI